jgi:hypothetical protein
MSHAIDLLDYPRVEIGWGYLNSLIDFIANSDKKIEFVYLFESHELIITDPYLITSLEKLNIPYKEKLPQNSIRYILK